jgi:hypothetical protein
MYHMYLDSFKREGERSVTQVVRPADQSTSLLHLSSGSHADACTHFFEQLSWHAATIRLPSHLSRGVSILKHLPRHADPVLCLFQPNLASIFHIRKGILQSC